MRKLLAIVLFITLSLSFLFATELTDYQKGYLQGYQDAKDGKDNEVSNSILDFTGPWLVKNYVDENGNAKPGRCYIGTNWQKGSYSNTSVSNGNLVWYFIVDKQGVAFKIYENADLNSVKGSGTNADTYTLTITSPDGSTATFSGTNYSDRIWFINEKKAIETLLDSGKVKLVIEHNYQPTKYNLGVFDGSGFATAYVQAFGSEFSSAK